MERVLGDSDNFSGMSEDFPDCSTKFVVLMLRTEMGNDARG